MVDESGAWCWLKMATSATSTARRSNATTASGFAKDTFVHFLSCLLCQKASFGRGQMSYSSTLVPRPPFICCHLSSFVSFALIFYGSGLQKSNQAALKLLSHYSALTAYMHLRARQCDSDVDELSGAHLQCLIKCTTPHMHQPINQLPPTPNLNCTRIDAKRSQSKSYSFSHCKKTWFIMGRKLKFFCLILLLWL